MRPDSRPVTTFLPVLSDDAVYEVNEFLYDILHIFEACYGDQLHRYYAERSFEELDRSGPRNPPEYPHYPLDDPPF